MAARRGSAFFRAFTKEPILSKKLAPEVSISSSSTKTIFMFFPVIVSARIPYPLLSVNIDDRLAVIKLLLIKIMRLWSRDDWALLASYVHEPDEVDRALICGLACLSDVDVGYAWFFEAAITFVRLDGTLVAKVRDQTSRHCTRPRVRACIAAKCCLKGNIARRVAAMVPCAKWAIVIEAR